MNIIEETKNYWIINDKLIFKYGFNSPLDEYIGVIGKYNKLLFSNYDDLEILTKKNNVYYYEFENNYKKSCFNFPISNLPNCLAYLELG